MTIKKITDLLEVLDYLRKEDLNYTTIMLDIDDTLVKAKPEYGFNTCPNKMFRESIIKRNYRTHSNGLFYSYCNTNYLDVVRTYNELIEVTKWRSTENAVKLVTSLIKLVPHIYYFTARGTEIHKPTIAMLKKLKLYPKNPRRIHRDFPNVTGRSGMRGNIIYAGGYDKCKLLMENGFAVHKTYILVDDSLSNLRGFENYCNKNGLINFIGLHYTP